MSFGVLLLAAISSVAQITFPATAVGTAATQQGVPVTLTVAGTVAYETIVTLGQMGLDFTLPATPVSSCTGATTNCTQSVAFTPTAPGLRLGAVELFNAGGELLGETLISGTGTGGLAVLVPGNTLPFAGDGSYLDAVQDSISALSAELYSPTSVAIDGAGNLYIADRDHNRIRMVAASTGLISTVAGTGAASYTGDGALATGATLNAPAGIALDGAGNLYIADTGNNVIRKVDGVTHDISTVAGNEPGTAGFGGDGTPATSVGVLLDGPQGVAVDAAGDIYIADTINEVVREVSAATGGINTIAGKFNGAGIGGYNGDGIAATAATLNSPYAVAFDAAGDVLIADAGNNRIREVNATTQFISTVAGNGTPGFSGDNAAATSAELNAPTGIALDPAGDLYIGDTQNNRIRKVNATSGDISTLAVSGGEYLLDTDSIANTIAVRGPQGLLVDANGNVFFADTLAMQVWEVVSNMAALDFTATPVRQGNVSAAPMFQTIENDGNEAAVPLAFTSITAGTNAEIDTTTTASTCVTTSPLVVDADCTIGVFFAPAATPVLTVNTTEAGTVSAAYTTVPTVTGPNSPLAIVAVGVAEPLNSTTTTVSANPHPSLYGQAVTFTVQVTTGTGTGTLTGTVSIYDTIGGVQTTLASGLALNASGAATFTISTLAVGVHSITASYSGDAGHNASTSTDNGVSPWIQIVEEQTSIALTSSANPSDVGQSVTFTATVTQTDGGGVLPDGTLSFLDGTTTLADVQLTGGVATFTTSTLANGLHPITAVYSGDVTKEILGETSVVLEQDVQAVAAIAVTTSGSPSFYGAPVTFTATITSSATTPASGTVNFFDGGVQIGTGTLTGGSPDIAQFTTAALAIGTHTITATYGGDNYNTGAASAPISQVVTQTVTSDAIAATPNPGIAGAAETLTATVTVTKGGGTPTGLVTFTSGPTVLGTANLNTSGVATISPVLAPGTYSIVATYAGDNDDAGSQSSPLSLTVFQAITTTTLTVSPNPSTYLSPVTFTAVVAGNGAIPTGTVQFFASGTLIGAGTLNTSGVATITYSSLAIGNYAITAVYEGDTNDATSTSAAVSLTVGKIPTITDLGSTTTVGSNPQVDLVATVVSSVGPVPTGTVTFTDASTTLGTATLDANGVATLVLNQTPSTYAVYAVYSGDTYHLASTSQPLTVVVAPVTFTMTLSPTTLSLKTTQYGEVGIVMNSEDGFADTIDLGCLGLPAGVTCHFSSLSVNLAANGSAIAQLTIDTNSPLTGGSEAMNRRAGSGGALLAGVLLPFGVLFGWIFRRQRRRMTAVFTMVLLIALSAVALVTAGCSGISSSSAAPGTYTIEVVGSGTTTGVTVTQNVTVTITQ